MTPDEFKELVASRGSQAAVAEKTGYSIRQIERLCNGQRAILERHVIAVKRLKKKI